MHNPCYHGQLAASALKTTEGVIKAYHTLGACNLALEFIVLPLRRQEILRLRKRELIIIKIFIHKALWEVDCPRCAAFMQCAWDPQAVGGAPLVSRLSAPGQEVADKPARASIRVHASNPNLRPVPHGPGIVAMEGRDRRSRQIQFRGGEVMAKFPSLHLG